jgi:hypothetical protein
MNPEELAQAQMASQAQQGLGTPPPAPMEYQVNQIHEDGKKLMAMNIADQMQKKAESKEQEALALRAQADTAGGYAGYRGDPTANAQSGVPVDAQHPNTGWQPSSPEAHQLNVQLAERIQSGSVDAQTAVLAMQHPDVAPELKQALSVIAQQGQQGQSQAPVEPQGGLGQVPVPVQPQPEMAQAPQQ